MGAQGLLTKAWILGALASTVLASAPVNYIPRELRHLFHPDELDDYEHPGVVEHDTVMERGRRASGVEREVKENTYTLYTLGGAPCIMAQTECTFNLDYRTLRYGVQTVQVKLPKEPEISGSCVREGDTAVLTMRWSVFNFSLIFTENPEGNSYYLNTARLKYNQSLDIFRDTTYRGPVILETKKGWNYYFTPLGKSYACVKAEDQGPLNLYNEDDELTGNMSLYHTKFQPFVKRAKGKWGSEDHCLAKAIKVMREDVVPYVVSCIFLSSTLVLIAGYALFRKFNVKKTDYGFYGDGGPPEAGGGGDVYEMTDDVVQHGEVVNGVTVLNGGGYEEQQQQQQQQQVKPVSEPVQERAEPANPFRGKAKGSNPFNQ